MTRQQAPVETVEYNKAAIIGALLLVIFIVATVVLLYQNHKTSARLEAKTELLKNLQEDQKEQLANFVAEKDSLKADHLLKMSVKQGKIDSITESDARTIIIYKDKHEDLLAITQDSAYSISIDILDSIQMPK